MNKKRNINRRQFIGTTSAAALSLSSQPTFAIGGKSQPNILFLITDQQHINAISGTGNEYIRTPALDEFVARGAHFQDSYCTYPLCSPSRGSMFSGRMPCENGVYENGHGILSSMANFGQWFREKTNYETYYTGKWHLPRSATNNIPGFNVLAPGINGQGNIGDASVSDACAGFLLNNNSANPFLFVASFTQPHDICQWLRINALNQPELRYPELADRLPPLPRNFQYDANEPQTLINMRNKNEPARGSWEELHWRFYLWSYYRNVEMADAEVGRILDALETADLLDNTLLVFTADHGEGCAHHQMVRKSSLYDEAAKVPFIARWAGHIKENHANQTSLVSGLDLFPTFCDYADIEPPLGSLGRSLRPVLEGNPGEEPEFVAVEGSDCTGRVIRTKQYKYISYLNDPVDQLFDMQADPGETNNLAQDTKYATVLQEHKKLRDEWIDRLAYSDNLPPKSRWPQN